MDSGTDGQFFNLTLCTGLHLLAKDVVSFYYILSGFTMTWGYISRYVFAEWPHGPWLSLPHAFCLVLSPIDFPCIRLTTLPHRDFDSHEVRWRYWVRRFARFYPDFAISSVVTFALKTTYMFGYEPGQLSPGAFPMRCPALTSAVPPPGAMNSDLRSGSFPARVCFSFRRGIASSQVCSSVESNGGNHRLGTMCTMNVGCWSLISQWISQLDVRC